MKRRAVVISPEARNDLLDLYDRIAASASPNVALAYIERIEAYLNGFDLASERGTRRDDLRHGLRTAGFERRVTIAFEVKADRVTILRLLHGGRNWKSDLQRAKEQ